MGVRKTDVAITKGADIRNRTLEALRLIGGMEKVVGKGDKVFFKPNVVDGSPFESGEVVQLETMEVLVKEAFRVGASEVLMGEVPTIKKQTDTIKAYMQLAERVGAKYLELDRYPFVPVKVEEPVMFEEVHLPEPMVQSDVFIDVPCLKAHARVGVTVAFKNMYGLISSDERRLFHTFVTVEEIILDLFQAKKAALVVVDGTYSTNHIGPRSKNEFVPTFRRNLTLASYDAVAIDTVSAYIQGVDSKSMRFLKWAEEKGLGTRDLANINILGVPLQEAYFGKSFDFVEHVNSVMKKAKVLNCGACTGCMQVPVQVIQLGDDAFKKNTLFVIGPGATAAVVNKNLKDIEEVVLCGYCTAPTFYNELKGHFVPGCPPEAEDLQKKIKERTFLG